MPLNDYLPKTQSTIQPQAIQPHYYLPAHKPKMSATDMVGLGIGASNAIASTILGAEQIKLAKAQQMAQDAQRHIENTRYEEQKKRHINATNDAAATASRLKSTQAQISQPLPMERA